MDPVFNVEGDLVGFERGGLLKSGLRDDEVAVILSPPSRIGNYMHTSNGKKYWPLDPKPSEVHPEVIAHHLANKCRYNGATQHKKDPTKIFYSVAEHSVYVSLYVEHVLKAPQFALEALLHDGSEAYNGDLIRPLKYDPLFREPFKRVEDLNEAAVGSRFNLVYPFPKEIKIADEAVTNAEIQQIMMRNADEDWTVGELHDNSATAPYHITMLDPYWAKLFFQERLREVLEDRHRYTS